MQEELVRYTDSWGQKRFGFKRICKICNKEFVAKKNSGGVFCSRQCSSKNKSLTNCSIIKCAFCGKEKSKPNSRIENSKHKIHFCSRKCKDVGQRIENGITEIWPSSYKNGQHIENRKLLDMSECVGCKEDKEYLLVIHHIDSDRTNNSRDNLEVVCSNCHLKRHLRLNEGKWVVDYKCLTPRELLKDL